MSGKAKTYTYRCGHRIELDKSIGSRGYESGQIKPLSVAASCNLTGDSA